MCPYVSTTVPLEYAGVEPIAQDRMYRTDWNRCTAFPVDETRGSDLLLGGAQRERAGRVPLEQTSDQWAGFGIRLNYPLSVWPSKIPIAQGGHRGPDALLGLLLHALTCFLRQVVDVVLRHQHLDAVHELFRRS